MVNNFCFTDILEIKNCDAKFNGFGCLVASFISLMKDDVGNIYIEPQSNFGEMNEDYLYIVQEQSDGCSVKVYVDGSQGSMPPVCLETLLGKVVN